MKTSVNVVTLALALSFFLSACSEETFQNVAGALYRVVLLLIVYSVILALPIILALKVHECFLSKQRSLLCRIVNIGVVFGIIGVLAAIAIPNVITTGPRLGSRVTNETKMAVTQATVYAQDKGVYPTSLKVLREAGYANVPDKDPYDNDYVLSPLLTQGSTPIEGDNVYVFSKGPKGDGVYPEPFAHDTCEDGSIGYSSVHGSWGYPPTKPC